MVTQEPYSRAKLFATYAGPLKKIQNITEKNVTELLGGGNFCPLQLIIKSEVSGKCVIIKLIICIC